MTLDNVPRVPVAGERDLHLTGSLLPPRLSGAVLGAATLPFVLDSPHDVLLPINTAVQATGAVAQGAGGAVAGALHVLDTVVYLDAINSVRETLTAAVRDPWSWSAASWTASLVLAAGFVIVRNKTARR